MSFAEEALLHFSISISQQEEDLNPKKKELSWLGVRNHDCPHSSGETGLDQNAWVIISS